MNDFFSASLYQLLMQSPLLIVCIVGMILALSSWKRCPSACLLILLATGLQLLCSVTHAFSFNYIFVSQQNWNWEHNTLQRVLWWMGSAYSIIGAISWALMIAAAFVCRNHHSNDLNGSNIGVEQTR